MERLSRITVFIKYGLYALVFASAIVLAMDTTTQAAAQDTDTSTMVISHEFTMVIQRMCNDTTDCYYAHCRNHCNPVINWPPCQCSYYHGACFSNEGGYCDSGGGGEGGGPTPE